MGSSYDSDFLVTATNSADHFDGLETEPHYPLSCRCSINILQILHQRFEAFVSGLSHERRFECHTYFYGYAVR